MNFRPSRAIPLIAATVLLVLGGLFLYHIFLGMDPQDRAAIIERGVERAFHVDLSLAKADLSYRKGLEVTLSGLCLESEDGFGLEAHSLKALFLLRNLVRGDFTPRWIILDEPRLRLDRSMPLVFSGTGPKRLPEIQVKNGLILSGPEGEDRLLVDDINLFFSYQSLKVTAEILGGQMGMDLDLVDEGWQGGLTLRSAELGRIHPSWSGFADLKVSGYVENGENLFRCEARVDDFRMPWWRESMADAGLSFELSHRGKQIQFRDFLVETPLVVLGGEASLQGIDDGHGIGSAVIDSSLSSSEFDYEAFIELLPLHLFPEWLKELLGEQVRGGTATIADMGYRGTFGDLLSGTSMVHGLRVEGILFGQSFGAGHDESRVEQITGRAELAGSALSFRHLSGSVGSSTIESLDLVFHDILSSDMLLSLSLEVDMELVDFVKAWSAAMVPPALYGLLDPFGDASAGRVRGFVETRTDLSQPEPTLVQGRVILDNSDFSWRGNRLASVSGVAVKESWHSPLSVVAEGVVDGISVEEVNLVFPDIFGREPYTISFELSDVPSPPELFRFEENSRIVFTGTGRDTLFEGEVSLYSEGLRVAGDSYAPKEGAIEGRGKATVNMGMEPEVVLDDVRVAMRGGDVLVAGVIGERRAQLTLEGRLDLACIDGGYRERLFPLDGFFEGRLTFCFGEQVIEEGGFVEGRGVFERAGFRLGDETVIVDGVVVAEGERFILSDVLLEHEKLSAVFNGRLVPGDTWLYRGKISARDLVIDERGFGAGPQNLDMISVTADLSVEGADFRGLRVDSIRSELSIHDGKVELNSMEWLLPAGDLSGSAGIDRDGLKRLDVEFKFKDKNVAALLRTLSPNGTLMDGSLQLNGWLRGDVDSLDGHLTFNATRGAVRRYTVLSKIFTVTNVYKLMTSERTGLAEGGFAYDSISATVKVNAGVGAFEDFRLESPSIQMSAVGQYDISKKHIDAIVGIQPLESVDRLIGIVPVFNWILLGEDQRLIVISARVRGHMADPAVTIAPLDTVSETLSGVLLRTLRLPLDIIISPGKMLPGRR